MTGQLVTTVAKTLPQLPFSHFHLHFREGGRSPLITPPGCGTYDGQDPAHPWSGRPRPGRRSATSDLPDHHRARRGPCPPGGLPPFHPGFEAGTLNNGAGAYSPFNMRLTRSDGEQEMTHFSLKLPPGVRRQARRHPLLLRGGDRRGQGPHRPPRRPGRARQPLLPGRLRDRPHPGRSRGRRPAHLRPRQASTSPAPTTAPRSRSSRSPRPWPAPSTSAPWSSARR